MRRRTLRCPPRGRIRRHRAPSPRTALRESLRGRGSPPSVGSLRWSVERAPADRPLVRRHGVGLPLSEPEWTLLRWIGVDADERVECLRRARLLGNVGCLIDLALHPRVDLVQRRVGYPALVQSREEARDRIVLALPSLDLARGHVRLIVVLGVPL